MTLRLIYSALLFLLWQSVALAFPDTTHIDPVIKDTARIRHLRDKGLDFFADQQVDSAFVHYRYAARLVQHLPHASADIRLSVWKGLGVLESARGHVDSSLMWIDKGLDYLNTEENNPKLQVDFLINKGATYYSTGNVAKALEPYILATDICRANDFNQQRAILLNNLGIFYRTLERYDDAIKLYKESYEIRKDLNDTFGMANNLFNLAGTYSFIKEDSLALNSIVNAKSLFIQLGKTDDMLLCQLAEGSALVKLNRMQEALITLKPLETENLDKLNDTHLFVFHLSLATVYLKLGDLYKSLDHLRQIEQDVIASNMNTEKAEYYEIKSDLAYEMGDYQNAYVNQKLFVKESKVYNDAENKRLKNEMETKYLAKEKDVEIQLLQADSKVNALQLHSSNQRTLALSIILFILTGAMFVLYYAFKKIKLKNAQILKADQEKETLLKEIHHRVKNNLQVISALLTLQSKYVEDENALEALRLGHDRVESMALIHKDLYQHDNLKGVNTKVYLEKLVHNLLASYKIGQGEVQLNMNISEIWLDVDTMIPLGLMINELLSNTMKHAFIGKANGKLNISLEEVPNGIRLQIKDNGPGITDFGLLKTKSFGYSLIQSFARKLDAEVEYMNDDGLNIELLIKEYKKVA